MLWDTRHNYVRRIMALIKAGNITGTLGMLDVYHDDDCAVFSGGFCNCDCEIEYVPTRQTNNPKGAKKGGH